MSKKHYLSNEDISILCSELASVVSSGLTITGYSSYYRTERIRTRLHFLKRYSAL